MAVGAIGHSSVHSGSEHKVNHQQEAPIKKKPLFEEAGGAHMASLTPAQKNVSVFC